MDAAEDILRSTSGEDIVDFIFKKILWFLENKMRGIYRIKNLMDPDKPKAKLDGLVLREKIYLEHCYPRPYLIKVLIHEVSHRVFDNPQKSVRKNEEIVLGWEELLWKMFSKEQKQALGKFVPKRSSKEVPDPKK